MQDFNPTQLVGLIARHQTRLRGLVRCLLVRPADVDDVLQEINAVLWEKGYEFRLGSDFWAWASQIARFKALNHIRKFSRDRLVFDDTFLNDLADLACRRLEQSDDRREALVKCLNELPPAQRQLIDLRYTGGHAIESIAQIIGRPHASIRQTLYRIRQSLLACIESKLEADGDFS
ncbi:MAG: sigma-70 family RNA polymerase sigma factor [Planctomycetes bacterium]|nr:sigma-70 family RNA polymerase sigma factor [Planctomycetota bacterium]